MELKRGFSLIELVIVVGLVSLLALGLSAVMLTTLANSTRIRSLAVAKQTGDYALGQIQELVRNAKTAVSCNSASNTITLTNPDGGTTIFASSGTAIASNSAAITPVGMNIANFSLTCAPSDTVPAIVMVAFDVQAVGAYSTQPVHFATSIQIRNQ